MRGAAVYASRRVASELATVRVALALTPTEARTFQARARDSGHKSPGLWLRSLGLAAAPEARVGLAASPDVTTAARWLVQLLEQLPAKDVPGPVRRAADDLALLLAGEGTAHPEAPKSGPRVVLELTQAARDDYAAAIAQALDVVDMAEGDLVRAVAGDEEGERARVAIVVAELVKSGALVKDDGDLHLVREEELDSDPVAEMLAAAPPPAPILRADLLADVVWPPRDWRREAAPWNGTPPSPREVLRVLAKPQPRAAIDARWSNVRGAWITLTLDKLIERRLARFVPKTRAYQATDAGLEAASLTPEERTIPLLPELAPARAAPAPTRTWKRTWTGKGKAHTVSKGMPHLTVCGKAITPPKWRTAPAEADDCGSCASMRESATGCGAESVR